MVVNRNRKKGSGRFAVAPAVSPHHSPMSATWQGPLSHARHVEPSRTFSWPRGRGGCSGSSHSISNSFSSRGGHAVRAPPRLNGSSFPNLPVPSFPLTTDPSPPFFDSSLIKGKGKMVIDPNYFSPLAFSLALPSSSSFSPNLEPVPSDLQTLSASPSSGPPLLMTSLARSSTAHVEPAVEKLVEDLPIHCPEDHLAFVCKVVDARCPSPLAQVPSDTDGDPDDDGVESMADTLFSG